MTTRVAFDEAVLVRPLVGPPERLRVWIGTPSPNRPQIPSVRLDGVPVDARTLTWPRRFQSMVGGRVWSGVVDIPCGDAELTHRVDVALSTDRAKIAGSVTSRGLPRRVPDPRTPRVDGSAPTGGSAFRVLLVSCYALEHDKGTSRVVRRLAARIGVDLVLAAGDQVYLDQPWRKALAAAWKANEGETLSRFLEDKYWRSWGVSRAQGVLNDKYAQILRAGPFASIPDDHEYWNNYPNRSPASPFTMFDDLREAWAATAKALFDSFQLAEVDTVDPTKPPVERYDYPIEVEPLSFWMMDNRTFREADLSTSLRPRGDGSPSGLDLFTTWVDSVLDRRSIPVLVTGPSLIQGRKVRVRGMFGDYNLANYGDYPLIVEQVMRMARAGLPVLLLTGDVHYGRVLRIEAAADRHTDRGALGEIHEVISSPVALVSSLAKGWAPMDEKRFTFHDTRYKRRKVRRLFPDAAMSGNPDMPELAEAGDHVTMLSFTRTTGGLQLQVTYHMIPELLGVHPLQRTITLKRPPEGRT
jgi:hypothetical protein